MSVISEIVDDLEFDRREKSVAVIAGFAALIVALFVGVGFNQTSEIDNLQQASATGVQVDKSELGYLRGRN